MVTDSTKSLSASFVIALTIAYLIALGILGEIFSIFGVKEEFLYLAFFPVAEEAFKYYVSNKFHSYSFKIIVLFGALEFIFGKIPNIYLSYDANSTISVIFALTAFNFHLATAYVYASKIFSCRPKFSLCIMTMMHVMYNSLDELDIQDGALIAISFIASVSPYLFLIYGRLGRVDKRLQP